MPFLVLLSLLAMGLTYAVMRAGRAWLGLQPLLDARILTVGLAMAGTGHRGAPPVKSLRCRLALHLERAV